MPVMFSDAEHFIKFVVTLLVLGVLSQVGQAVWGEITRRSRKR